MMIQWFFSSAGYKMMIHWWFFSSVGCKMMIHWWFFSSAGCKMMIHLWFFSSTGCKMMIHWWFFSSAGYKMMIHWFFSSAGCSVYLKTSSNSLLKVITAKGAKWYFTAPLNFSSPWPYRSINIPPPPLEGMLYHWATKTRRTRRFYG